MVPVSLGAIFILLFSDDDIFNNLLIFKDIQKHLPLNQQEMFL